MKRIIKNGVIALTVALAATAVMTGALNKKVNAETISTNCVVRPHTTLTRTDDNRVSVKFYIEPGCPTQQVSLMVYKTTAKVNPLSTQKMFSYTSTFYPAGEHTVTAALPDDCFFQADLFKGAPIMELTDNGDYSNGMGYLLGGSKDCLTPTPTTVNPVTPVVVTTAAAVAPAPAPKPAALPSTGPGNVAAVVTGVALSSGLAYNFVTRRRSRQ